MKLFGEGKPASGVEEVFGDFTAVSTGEHSIFASKEMKHLGTYKGHHGGGTTEERLIDISIFNAKY